MHVYTLTCLPARNGGESDHKSVLLWRFDIAMATETLREVSNPKRINALICLLNISW